MQIGYAAKMTLHGLILHATTERMSLFNRSMLSI